MDHIVYHQLLKERLAEVEAGLDDAANLTAVHYVQLFAVAGLIPAILMVVAWWV